MGRFIQPDSIIPDPYDSQSWDRYHYAGNNPLRFVDPTGHEYCNPKECGYAHDYDDDTPAPDWLQALAEEYYQTGTQTVQDGANGNASILSDIAFSADMISMALNYGEVAIADTAAISLIITGCASGLQGCIASLILSAQVDFAISFYSPLGIAENVLGGLAFSAIFLEDFFQENTGFSSNGYYIGIDTLVSGRNFIIGWMPEANIDYLVGKYQVAYDIDRREGRKPGGSIEISQENLIEIIKALVFGK